MSRLAGEKPKARLATGVAAQPFLLGLDTSHFQNVNWESLVTTYGLKMGHAKASQGTGFRDPDFVASMRQMAAVGLPIRNGYHYLDATQSPATQADIVTDLCMTSGANMVTLDLEKSSGRSQSQLHGEALEFGHELLARSNLQTCAYLGGYAHNGTGAGLCGPTGPFRLWWYARYPGLKTWPTSYSPRLDTVTVGKDKPDMWQWTDNFHGMDADISPFTADELLGGDVPLAGAADKAFIQDALNDWLIASKRAGTPGQMVAFPAFISSIDVNTANNLAVTNAVNAAIPGITQALIDALPAALAQAVVNVDVTVNGKDAS